MNVEQNCDKNIVKYIRGADQSNGIELHVR